MTDKHFWGRITQRGWIVLALAAGMVLAAVVVVCGTRDRRPVVVCIGDSLTSCGGKKGHYCDWLRGLMPEARIVDAGIGGDTLDGGRARFERDVSKWRPAVVLIALGANDFWRDSRPVEEMAEDLEAMIQRAQELGSRVIVASCFGDRAYWEEVCTEFEPGRYELAASIAAMERKLCAKYGCRYIPNMQADVKPNRLPPFWDETDHPCSNGNERVAMRLLPGLRSAFREARDAAGKQD
jgi:lysophospholipase L1-like esterase